MDLKLQYCSLKWTLSGLEVMTPKPGDVWRVESMQLEKKIDRVCTFWSIFTFSNAAEVESWDPSTGCLEASGIYVNIRKSPLLILM